MLPIVHGAPIEAGKTPLILDEFQECNAVLEIPHGQHYPYTTQQKTCGDGKAFPRTRRTSFGISIRRSEVHAHVDGSPFAYFMKNTSPRLVLVANLVLV